MTPLRSYLHFPPSNTNKSFFWRFITSKLARFLITTFSVCLVLFVTLRFCLLLPAPYSLGPPDSSPGSFNEALDQNEPSRKGRLHLLVPATSSNEDLCKLLLSAQILGYPTPVLINYGNQESEDAYDQHLAKVQGILKYLDGLHASSQYAEDLVLIIDGYDIWFQLRPDVLISRYYDWQQAADTLVRDEYGEAFVKSNDIRNTVVFGPDKLCWPVDYNRPACWAIPEATLSNYAFGPHTAGGRLQFNMPKWLNSGTILGPVEDLKEVFRTTLENIHTKYEYNSDQFYFAEIFGEQEFARISEKPELLESRKSLRYGDEFNHPETIARRQPDLSPDQKTEYHIGIDYNSSLFQTAAFYKQFLTFMRPAESWTPPHSGDTKTGMNHMKSPYVIDMPRDLQDSLPPFEALKAAEMDPDKDSSWSDVELHYNTITGQIPVLIHFTGEKQLRQFWWQTLWFQPRGQDLRLASRETSDGLIASRPINGLIWYNALDEDASGFDTRLKDGALSDLGGWYSWNKLCKPYEEVLYGPPSEDYFHSTSHETEEATEEDLASD